MKSVLLIAGLCVATLALARPVSAVVTLTVANVSVFSGQLNIPVSILITSEEGDEVSGLQFDIVVDHHLLRVGEVVLGDAGIAAQKGLSSSFIDDSTVRVVIIGFNQQGVPDGPIAVTRVDDLSVEPGTATAVTLLNVNVTDPLGNRLRSEILQGSVSIIATVEVDGEGEGEGEGDGGGLFGCAGTTPEAPGLQGMPGDLILLALLGSVLLVAGRRRIRME